MQQQPLTHQTSPAVAGLYFNAKNNDSELLQPCAKPLTRQSASKQIQRLCPSLAVDDAAGRINWTH